MNKNGFTLLEITFVILIIGILIPGGINLISSLQKQTKIKQTKEILEANKKSIISYVMTYKKLPTQLQNKNKDAWNRNLTYIYDINLTNDNRICISHDTSISLKENNNIQIDDIAFIIQSKGFDTQDDYILNNSLYTFTTKKTHQDSLIDYIEFVTLHELRTSSYCQGKQINIHNDSLPFGYTNNDYNLTIYANKGLQFNSPNGYDWNWTSTLPFQVDSNCIDIGNHFFRCQDLKININKNNLQNKEGNYQLFINIKDLLGNEDNQTFVITLHPS